MKKCDAKACDACGIQGANCIIGGAVLCRKCAEDVICEIDKARAEGKLVNALGIARAIFRETYSAGNYLLRDIPKDLMDEVRNESHKQGISMRDWILDAMRAKLSK